MIIDRILIFDSFSDKNSHPMIPTKMIEVSLKAATYTIGALVTAHNIRL